MAVKAPAIITMAQERKIKNAISLSEELYTVLLELAGEMFPKPLSPWYPLSQERYKILGLQDVLTALLPKEA